MKLQVVTLPPLSAHRGLSARPSEPTTWPTDPCDPSYQAEYSAAERHAAARHELRIRLEAGRLEAASIFYCYPRFSRFLESLPC